MEQKETRGRIVDAAAELFHRNGFQGTTLAAVGERASVQGGSLYYCFKTKEVLLQAALDRYRERLGPEIMEPSFAATEDPIERVFRVLARYRALLLETDYELGCPIGNLAIEMADADPETRAGLAANFDLWAATIEETLREAAGRLPPQTDLRRLSRFVLTTMEGGVLLACGYREIRPFDDAVAGLKDYFKYLLASGAPTRGNQQGE